MCASPLHQHPFSSQRQRQATKQSKPIGSISHTATQPPQPQSTTNQPPPFFEPRPSKQATSAMKVVDEEHLESVVGRSFKRAMEGAAWGVGIGGLAALALNKFSPWYRRLTPALKAYSLLVPVIGGMMIIGEGELVAIEREHHRQHHKEQMQKRMEEFRRLDAETHAARQQAANASSSS
ncbi:hypothetical protein PTSG_12476 [Salpingoeca rosetta]|uniref:Uncharacterized protein n=1 Tax=Salpingoeca rosetta (strain ATCC 50818 / BSB-021) TaxID=946362 RepID=F2UEJ6_SALR5|nr:uncharacterized protein PTSG_12476 [Salpingoeca rosetta]EGD75046.1 hypothetical protein PTSG_12476 [Salpingoeca rosetta]|eukprot:XP_004992099.1 hypothetical protein PTSG_12476 [Salpingoeca rosetta]